MGFLDNLAHAWNVFRSGSAKIDYNPSPMGYGSSYSPSSNNVLYPSSGDRNIVEEVVNKIAVYVAKVEIVHARLDDNERYTDVVNSGLQYCLNTEANIDQGPTHFKLDLANVILTEGVAAVVPVDTTVDPRPTGSYDIKTMRIGKITEWFPRHVRVNLYDDRTGEHKEVVLPKETVAIIENPHYQVMNRPNSSFQRLLRKLTLLDTVDDEIVSKRLDLIIQLPYTVKSEKRRAVAEQKRKDLEMQLRQSEIGVGYIDATDSITQLNRPIENTLMPQVEFFTQELYSKLGVTQEILEGKADQQQMLNFENMTIEPILDAITEEFSRKFLTRTARSQKQGIIYQRKPYKLVPMSDIADMADKFTRNEIMSANEVRSWVGLKPVDDPRADELRNANMPREDTGDIEPSAGPTLGEIRQNRKAENET